jgi:hypothetical protein
MAKKMLAIKQNDLSSKSEGSSNTRHHGHDRENTRYHTHDHAHDHSHRDNFLVLPSCLNLNIVSCL